MVFRLVALRNRKLPCLLFMHAFGLICELARKVGGTQKKRQDSRNNVCLCVCEREREREIKSERRRGGERGGRESEK